MYLYGFESHEVYSESMRPVESSAGHLQFHLRYEPTNLELLERVFEVSGPDFVRDWIEREPTGQYARRAAFLYEFLTGHELETEAAVGGNYVSALNDELVVTASQDQATNIKKWRVRDNMPGTRHFCPSIWKSQQLEGAAGFNIAARYTRLQEDFGDDMLARAAVWLTNRESRASFAIDGEAEPYLFATLCWLRKMQTLLFKKRDSNMERDLKALLEKGKMTLLSRLIPAFERDAAAIETYLVTPWTNSPVEGQINRLKMLKRTVFGRIGFQLLRARVLQLISNYLI